MLERHGSLIVAGLAQGAGKTTTLTALLATLPPALSTIELRGSFEDFSFLRGARPEETLLLVNELSSHLPHYLWGDRAIRALSLIGEGFALAATLHADSATETVRLLTEELGAPARDVARIDLIATVRVRAGPGRAPVHRLVALDALGPGGPTGVHITPLVTYDEVADRHTHDEAAQRRVADPTRVAALAGTALAQGERA